MQFFNFQCDGTPLSCQGAQVGQFPNLHRGNHHLIEGSCFPSYPALTSLVDLQSNTNCIGQSNSTVTPLHVHQLRQHQNGTFVTNPQSHSNQQLVPFVNGSPAFMTPNQPGKVYSANSVIHPHNNYINPMSSFVFGNPSVS